MKIDSVGLRGAHLIAVQRCSSILDYRRNRVKNWWLSWYHEPDIGGFELDSPWWRSGFRASDDAATICAAVKALTADEAKRQVTHAYDESVNLEWRFCEERPDDWTPFGDRFQKADWMRWP